MDDNEIIEKYKKYEPIFGSWYIKRFIGEGGFAKVFEITRNEFGVEYTSALKIITISKTKSEINTLRSEGMTDDDIRGYLRGIVEDTVSEIQLMYKLRGKGNIVSYEDHALIEHGDGMGWDILIKMEYLTSLSTYIRQQKGRLAKRDIIRLGVDICKSLEYCQRYSIIHRDIKADNIFISNEGEFKLGDFGIARVIERKDQTLSKKGTSAYMAPEVYKGQTYTSAVDIYSLGMVMYRLMNNNRGPFLPPYPQPMSLDDRDHAMMLRMSGEKFPKPSQVTRGRLVEIVLKACAYRPGERYSSPGFMRQELEAIYLDMDEMTTEEWVMIYDAEGRSTAATLSTSQSDVSVQQSPENPEPTGATEVLREEGATEALREEGATEVLRGDATEVLREEDATEVLPEEHAPAQSMLSRAAKTCIKCGGTIDHKFVFCPICGASQNEEPEQSKEPEPRTKPEQRIEPKEPEHPKNMEQPIDSKESESSESQKETGSKRKALWNSRKSLVIGGVCAAVLLLAVIIGVVINSQSTYEPTDPQRPWLDNVLMADYVYNSYDAIRAYTYEEIMEYGASMANVLGSEIKRNEIATITFLDSLDDKPRKAWDVSADGSRRVMAWVETRNDGLYDLYIAGKGGVSANSDSNSLFCFYTSVQQIQFNGNFHTENTIDMCAMFFLCNNLMNVDISNFDTSKVTDMSYMFSYCDNLTSLDVSGFDTSSVTDMEMMFTCASLTNLDVSGFDTSNVTDMIGMFSGCASLTSLDASGFNTSRVENMNAMFSGCASLTSLDVSGFDTSYVREMRYMFYGCNSLTSLDVSGFDALNPVDMSYMFNGCGSLTSIDISGFDTGFLLPTEMESMFEGCNSLEELYVMYGGSEWNDAGIPNGVTIHEASSGNTTQKTQSSSSTPKPSTTTQPPASSTPKPSATEQPPVSSEPEPERPDQNPPPDSSESRPDRPDRPDKPQ